MTQSALLPNAVVNLRDLGADGCGKNDCSAAFVRAIAAAHAAGKTLYIPTGVYLVAETLRLPSDFRLYAEPTARIVFEGERRKHRGEYLLTNDNPEGGNRNISITGGVWDGNNSGPGNAKPDIFDKDGYSGTVLNFAGVTGLYLSDMVLANSVTYNIRMARVENFTIENIDFVSDRFGCNQDGLHFNGEVRHGTVKNIRALSLGQTNDDLIALNADDSMERVENFGMVRGAIEDIVFENLFAEDCHTIIRMLSVTAPIRNITLRNIYGGYRCYAVNLDGARYCRTPLFGEAEFPDGVGVIENVTVENMTCRPTKSGDGPAVCLESVAENLTFRSFRFLGSAEHGPALYARNLVDTELIFDGNTELLKTKSDRAEIKDFSDLTVRRIR